LHSDRRQINIRETIDAELLVRGHPGNDHRQDQHQGEYRAFNTNTG
jgi:hypothetical protein